MRGALNCELAYIGGQALRNLADRVDSKDLPSHRALFRHGIANLECLELGGVPEGRYELIALPLRLIGFDASPVRAVLRTECEGA